MALSHQLLKQEKPEKHSGTVHNLQNNILTIPKEKYRIIKGVSVGGDAPKELMKIYEYSPGTKRAGSPKSWPTYITKTGHKWYPSESITEHLLNRIGTV